MSATLCYDGSVDVVVRGRAPQKRNAMKIWITKRALTEGITVEDGEVSETSPSMICYGEKAGYCQQYAHGEGKHWHRTPGGAESRAEQMRQAKIASVKKSLAKLERMTFKAPNV